MNPVTQQANGLKRPHPGVNDTSSSASNGHEDSTAVNSEASEAKRINLDRNNVDSTAIKQEVKSK